MRISQLQPTLHGFKVGMKLEAVDRKNPDLICVATVTNVIGNYFLVHFDEWDDSYDYWCQDDCPYIHPVGWCAENGKKLNPPNGKQRVGLVLVPFRCNRWRGYIFTTHLPCRSSLCASASSPKKKLGNGWMYTGCSV